MSSSTTRALRILEAVGEADRPPGATEIARTLDSTPGTVFRGLDALARSGLIARYQASSRYVLGPTWERLRQSLIAQFRLREVSLPYLRELASSSGETASVYGRLGWYALRIATVPGTNEVTNAPPLGEAQPFGAACAGRAIFAFLRPSEITEYRGWAKRHGLRGTPSNAELDEIAKRGLALGEAEFAGARALALPLRAQGTAIASIAIEGPVFDGSRSTRSAVASWRQIAGRIESTLRAQPALYVSPFAHLDPEKITL
jgi:IclR family acetate operon transcriptional repressor